MHYACCAVSAVLSNSPVLCSPARSFCVSSSQKSDPRTNSPSFHFLFFARLRGWAAEEKEEEKKEDEKEELGIFWVVFCGWRECRCGEAGVKWEVVGGWVLMNGSHVAATEDFLVW